MLGSGCRKPVACLTDNGRVEGKLHWILLTGSTRTRHAEACMALPGFYADAAQMVGADLHQFFLHRLRYLNIGMGPGVARLAQEEHLRQEKRDKN